MLEYAPPIRSSLSADESERSGAWRIVPACADSSTPTARYGHSLAYDPLTRQIIVVGGFTPNGSPLYQTQIDPRGGTYNIPEVWTAKRVDPVDPSDPAASPCYQWNRKTTFGNSRDIPAQAPPETPVGLAASVFISSTGYNTGYYSVFDNACENAGANDTGGSNSEANKLNAGGVYLDLDRTKLDARENLLLNLTYMPMGTNNRRPDGQYYSRGETAVIKVHLQRIGQSRPRLMSILQPRHMEYPEDAFRKTVHTLTILAPPTGGIREVLIPLSMDPAIDRIRIERQSGSAILIDASLYRLGGSK